MTRIGFAGIDTPFRPVTARFCCSKPKTRFSRSRWF